MMSGPDLHVSPARLALVFGELAAKLGDRLVTARAICDAHGRGEGLHDIFPPDAVAFPTREEEVVDILKICHQNGVPVIPFGAGTSLEGHVQARRGGICLDMSRMCRILEVNAADMDCRVEAGVTREQLNAHLRDMGLFFPLDPGANATLGGMAATRASGTNAVRYGTMREVTLGMSIVSADGKCFKTGGRALKSSAGYDLTRLFVGSEGTLGVITELQLRLFGIPEHVASAVCPFETLDGAIETVIAIRQLGLPLARLELLDETQMLASIAYSKLDEFEPVPTLFLEFHGSPISVDDEIAQVSAVARDHGGGEFRWAVSTDERSRLWRARHDAYFAGRALAPGKESIATDACVPISLLGTCIRECRDAADASELITTVLGHVGDGNFHMLILFDPADADERARAEALADFVARRAILHGGTSTGEHGIGSHKLHHLEAEHGRGVETMRTIKRALDPGNILNPGKTIPAA